VAQDAEAAGALIEAGAIDGLSIGISHPACGQNDAVAQRVLAERVDLWRLLCW